MPSGQDLVSRLRDETRQSLAKHLLRFEVEFKALQDRLSASISSVDLISRQLAEAGSIDLSPVEAVVSDAIVEARLEGSRRRDEEQSFLAHCIHEMRKKETQEEILTLLLDRAQRYAPRLALFVTRGNQFCGWNSRGFSAESDGRICSAVLRKDEGQLLGKALDVDALTTADDIGRETGLLHAFAGEAESPWHAFPMKAIQRPVAVLLAAPAHGRSCDLESLCILMDLTGLCIENMALKILQDMQGVRAAAAAAHGRETPAAAAPQEEPEHLEVPAAEATPLTFPEAPAVEAPADEVEEVVTTTPDAQVETEPEAAAAPSEVIESEPEAAAEAEIKAEALVAPDEEIVESEPPEEISRPVDEGVPETTVYAAEAEPGEPAIAAEAMASSIEVPVLDGLKSVRAAGLREVQPLSEEEKLHSDAKRFARLLASEIKLYNEQRVQEGRDNRDIYVRLKRDIDRSREMYEKRVSPTVTRKVDYFHDEIIRILGDNDPSTLGSDYPGPRIES